MNRIILGNCLDTLVRLPDKSIDLLCTDPPYGIGISKRGQIGTGRPFTPKRWDTSAPPKAYFDEMRRVSKAQIIWGGNYFANMLPASRCWLVWWKNDGLPCHTFADCEIAWTSFDKNAQVFNSRWRGFVRDSKEPRVGHPTQKALEVMKWCIASFSKPGDTVIDPFLGSGTTAVAAKLLGRNFIGVEQDEEYVAMARQRLRHVNDNHANDNRRKA
ncbi:DNA-methyltransferase [Methylocystis sp.]|uniref:DNA-methyltransferase n=1 Tax=Methylocystis sp. TaxID=1911079 RepID=UPI003D0F8A92